MKICLIGVTYPFRGGISHYTFKLAHELAKDHEVRVISFETLYPRCLFPGKTQLDFSARLFQIPHTPIIRPLDPRSWLRTLAAIRRQDPQLVVLQWWNVLCLPAYAFLCTALQCFFKGRVCYLCHNVLPHERGLPLTVLTLLGLFFARRFVVHSRADAAFLRRVLPGISVRTAPHPVYDQFRLTSYLTRAEAKRRLGLTGHVLLFFGQVRPYKGLEYLIDALPHVLAEMECTLLIVGEFYWGETHCRQRIERLGLGRYVRIVNRYVPNEEVEDYFAAADLLVLPYVTASQSGVLQIARSFDLPAVATRVGGLPDQLSDGKTGFLVPPRDSRALADAVLEVFRNRKWEEFARNIERTRSSYGWTRVAAAISSLADT